jgi:hypothetical protein
MSSFSQPQIGKQLFLLRTNGTREYMYYRLTVLIHDHIHFKWLSCLHVLVCASVELSTNSAHAYMHLRVNGTRDYMYYRRTVL